MKYIYARRAFDGMLCRFDDKDAQRRYMRNAYGEYETIARTEFIHDKRTRYTTPRWLKCDELCKGAALLVNF